VPSELSEYRRRETPMLRPVDFAPGMREQSPYLGQRIVLTTKHEKSLAIAPPFQEILGANVSECPFDTDLLGTFSGEVERVGSALDCVRNKCERGLDLLGGDLGIASEGSFGPHPYVPFIPGGQEIL
jgi:hypothetical protein